MLRTRPRTSHISSAYVVVLALCLGGCPGGGGDTGSGTSGTEGSTTADSTTDSTTPTMGEGGSEGSTDSATGETAGEESGETGLIPVPEMCEHPPLPACDVELTKCADDRDRDEVPFGCDNAPDYHNPDQADLDGDGFGDVHDLCPTLATDNNIADPDKDGVGNQCDLCPGLPSQYNEGALAVPFYMRVRGVPLQDDSDRDGVGDSCDNCVRVPNCQGFGDGDGLTPFGVGMEIDRAAADCQPDGDLDKIGDTCLGTVMPGAAGPVGFGDADDFDQDGLANIEDGCPRQPAPPRSCESAADCPDGAQCTPAGRCNHTDHDADGVGDMCDTCPDVANPEQVTEAGAALDDPDHDFIGAACERNEDCTDRANARPFGFYDISVGGRCCVTVYDGAPLRDPDGEPLVVDELGPHAAGVFELPPGCEEALAHSADGKAHKMESCNVDDPSELWQYLCLLPTWDQDYDDIPDECDLCGFAYDPTNAHYIDENNKEWENYGKYCRGEYDIKNFDPANMCEPQ